MLLTKLADMKKMILVLTALSFALVTSAQISEPIDPVKDKKEILGYTVQLIRTNDGSIGYDIMRNNKIELHQFQNPLVFSPKGISKKEDAFAVAEWVIKEYQKTGRWTSLVPPHISRTLNLSRN
jgi:hypothetical protein